jgi:hypothetical protein
MALSLRLTIAAVCLLSTTRSLGQVQPDLPATHVAEPRDVRHELPLPAFTYAAAGAPRAAVGAQAFALGLVAPDQRDVLGGGAAVWGAPVARLTLIADAQRNAWGNFSPSAAATFHVLGERRRGWSLGGLTKYKIDGFASGPSHDEIESELELGVLLSLKGRGYSLDYNLIGGRGLGDEGETDAESRLRIGAELGRYVWLGVDGQARLRVSGPRKLPNGRTWDFSAGPQALFGSSGFFAIVSAGPTTAGLTSSSLGFGSLIGIGGTT